MNKSILKKVYTEVYLMWKYTNIQSNWYGSKCSMTINKMCIWNVTIYRVQNKKSLIYTVRLWSHPTCWRYTNKIIIIIIIVSGEKVYSILGITSSDIDQFSKFFHFQNLLDICNKAIVKYPTTPQTHHYTTVWNIDVWKLACPVHCGSHSEK